MTPNYRRWKDYGKALVGCLNYLRGLFNWCMRTAINALCAKSMTHFVLGFSYLKNCAIRFEIRHDSFCRLYMTKKSLSR